MPLGNAADCSTHVRHKEHQRSDGILVRSELELRIHARDGSETQVSPIDQRDRISSSEDGNKTPVDLALDTLNDDRVQSRINVQRAILERIDLLDAGGRVCATSDGGFVIGVRGVHGFEIVLHVRVAGRGLGARHGGDGR